MTSFTESDLFLHFISKSLFTDKDRGIKLVLDKYNIINVFHMQKKILFYTLLKL